MFFYINPEELKNHLILLDEEKRYIRKLKDSMDLTGQFISPEIQQQLIDISEKLDCLERGVTKNKTTLEQMLCDFQIFTEETQEKLSQLEYDVKKLFS